ncbi:GspE/PulE family protein [Kumtagia ephedrae]|uniref:Type II/IV secretion system protein n=1 Tax=Kumtagia ephedrae TaxID=2116701 RepID=A0A2P7SLV3_9HYPH|nr:GspE/PulE family protein [Mesorhizobium ephedrae]PSJ63456.1 type II/IV secretion system protein [Mesorhizobium ephedrae]
MNVHLQRPTADEVLNRLVADGALSQDGAGRARAALTSTSHPFDIVLTELGLLREDELARHLASILQLPLFNDLFGLDAQLVDLVGLSFCEGSSILPLGMTDGVVSVAVSDPFSRGAIDALAFHLDRMPSLHIATRSQIAAQFKLLRQGAEGEVLADAFDAYANLNDADRLRDIAREAPVVRLVSRVINEAVERGATDIHIEPQEDNVRIRVRLDGLLLLAETVARSMHAGIVTRIKILAQLNIAERRIPQDGRLRAVVRGQNVDMRVSVVPSAHGEAIVLRVLDRSRVRLELEALGFDPAARARLTAMSQAANGIILITGPTGSGKTTTLYSMLKGRNSIDTKIFTVEDPVEYRLAGVTQLQVEPVIGLDFAAALRSVLRQDPDIILVGEVRDKETAEIAIRAALTGHLVLSTLHTNSATGAFTCEPACKVDPLGGVIGVQN